MQPQHAVVEEKTNTPEHNHVCWCCKSHDAASTQVLPQSGRSTHTTSPGNHYSSVCCGLTPQPTTGFCAGRCSRMERLQAHSSTTCAKQQAAAHQEAMPHLDPLRATAGLLKPAALATQTDFLAQPTDTCMQGLWSTPRQHDATHKMNRAGGSCTKPAGLLA
jgi:hypothetical protein